MDMTVGTVQGLLAAVFLMAGLVKVVQPKEKLTKRMSWVELRAEHDTFNRDCGAPGGYLNCVTGLNRNPSLADTLAAVGLTADQVGAALTHGWRGEYRMIGINAILVAMAVRILMVL